MVNVACKKKSLGFHKSEDIECFCTGHCLKASGMQLVSEGNTVTANTVRT